MTRFSVVQTLKCGSSSDSLSHTWQKIWAPGMTEQQMGWYADKYKEKWTQQSNVTISEIQAWKNYSVLYSKATKTEFKSHDSTEKCVEDLKVAA